jgi:hypothetical protein
MEAGTVSVIGRRLGLRTVDIALIFSLERLPLEPGNKYGIFFREPGTRTETAAYHNCPSPA